MKILYITTVGMTMRFFESVIGKLTAAGHTVDLACNTKEYPVPDFYRRNGYRVIDIDCGRSVFKRGNLRAIKQIREAVAEGGYDIVHCHTPIAGFIARAACRKMRKRGLRVFYTAHGFHFYRGCPMKNRLIFYPAEKLSARRTDTLVTINREDYEFAKRKFSCRVEYVPGVGIDTDHFKNTSVDVKEKRRELGIPENAYLMLSVGELNENKDHASVIDALSRLKDGDICYAVAGEGALRGALEEKIEALGLSGRVLLLGQRDDTAQLYKCCDLFVHPSHREGLPVSLMEAKAAGLPCIVTDVRGCRDLFNAASDIMCPPGDAEAIAEAIAEARKTSDERRRAAESADVSKYDSERIDRTVIGLYEDN